MSARRNRRRAGAWLAVLLLVGCSTAPLTIEEEREGLNLRYMIEVYAPAPRVDLFTPNGDPNFWSGPAPYGAPTHRDMINLWTPKEHRAPAADFSGVLKWLTDRNKR